MPDSITGTGKNGTTEIPTPIVTAHVEAELEDGEVPDVWGISFPKVMLPLGADSGYWTSEPLLDLSGDEDEELVRVWLHAPQKGT